MSNNDESAPQKKQRCSKAGYRPSRAESGTIRIEYRHPLANRVGGSLRCPACANDENFPMESARHRYRNRESGLPSV
ncbi:hypothetical protein HJC23_005849 [Cyclotella cryptica]|uniref:Uncharacterized protein n=1 Tax=Cyclotella cryptica TaxID=29204 RepID=A0ABD3RC31_9STRA|eukprot:CCRYP_000356-RA/>CCRYP_000356-RA protein AED:0.48 eAED:0.48 QI:0/-1/0/1/-1/1/1/0/76